MTTEDNGALRRTGPGETAEATTPTIEHPDPDESIIRLWQERGRLTAEADRILTLAGDDEDFKAQQRADALDEKATEIEERIAIMTPNGPTGWALQVALLALWRERGNRADHLDQRLIERLGAYFLGTVSPLLEVVTGVNPDAKLFALEAEMIAAYEGLNAAPDDNDAHEPWYERIWAAQQALMVTWAQIDAGIASKLRMVARSMGPVDFEDADTDSIADKMLKNTVKNAQRIGATVSVDPDAKLQNLWRKYLQNRADWDRVKDDHPDAERYAEASAEIERRIASTPAQSVLGIAIKLQIADSAHPEDKLATEDSQNLVSAREDAERLSGFEGVVLTGPDAVSAEIGGAS